MVSLVILIVDGESSMDSLDSMSSKGDFLHSKIISIIFLKFLSTIVGLLRFLEKKSNKTEVDLKLCKFFVS